MEARLSSDLILVENFLQILAHILIQEKVLNPYRVLAVARELLQNAVVHGNGKDPALDVVARVERLRGTRWRISVAHRGAGFDHTALCLPKQGGSPRSGYGIVLALSKKVSWADSGRSVTAEVSCPPNRKREGPA